MYLLSADCYNSTMTALYMFQLLFVPKFAHSDAYNRSWDEAISVRSFGQGYVKVMVMGRFKHKGSFQHLFEM